MSKRIVFIITDYGSFNNFLGDVAVRLVRLGNKIDVISSASKVIDIEDKYDYNEAGIVFHPVNLPRGFNPFKHYSASKMIHKIVNQIQPNVVSIHFTTGAFTTTFTGRLNYHTSATFHGLGYPVITDRVKRFVYKFVEDRCFKRVDEVWVLNRFDLELLESRRLNVPVRQVPTKGLGCDLEKFDPNKFSLDFKSSLRGSLTIEPSDFVIGFTGRYVTFKGFDKVVRAFKMLCEERNISNIKLLLIGGRDDIHPSGLTDLEEQWLLHSKQVINIGFSSKVQDYLSITDLFVFPSEKEGMPVCIIEALAMNVPVITADARGCNDLIVDGKNGILLQLSTESEIADGVLKLKDDTVFYNSLKEEIKTQRANYDRTHFINQQVDFFESK
ncbi:glycosyltransferase [Sphingobacterium corticis]|uniref:Glycosyltransferase n=1 Tax=Sphingobacterium corticis TaxID=1812823 RepID=A0ABW5NJR7_9SPHI